MNKWGYVGQIETRGHLGISACLGRVDARQSFKDGHKQCKCMHIWETHLSEMKGECFGQIKGDDE